MKRVNLAVLLALALSASCAKERPIDTGALTKNVDGEFRKKSDFLGTGSAPTVWLHTVTLVNTSGYGGADVFVGLQSREEVGHFEFTSDKLRFVSEISSHPDKPLPGASTLREVGNEWEITHHDVKLDEKDGHVTNKEVFDEDKPKLERRYFKFDFSKPLLRQFTDNEQCLDKKSTRLVDGSLESSPEYISFLIGVDYEVKPECMSARRFLSGAGNFSAEYRYSFKRMENNSYSPYVYKSVNGSLDPNMKRFGFFTTSRESLDPLTKRAMVSTLLNRWDPKSDHHFYFSEDFPDEFKWIFNDAKRGIFPLTNKIFEEAGVRARFYVHENTWGNGKVKRIGDLRYSIVQAVTDPDVGGLLGLGTSVASPYTGEIVNGNLYIYTGYLRYFLYKQVKDTFSRDKTRYRLSSLYNEMIQLFKDTKDPLGELTPDHWAGSLAQSPDSRQLFANLLSERTFYPPGFSLFNYGNTAPLRTQTAEDLFPSLAKLSRSKGITFDGEEALKLLEPLKHTINETLAQNEGKWGIPEVGYPADPFVNRLLRTPLRGMDPEAMLQQVLYVTSIHEFGHVLGLRHNFYGSVDEANFLDDHHVFKDVDGKALKDPETGEPRMAESTSSSVMDYVSFENVMFNDLAWGPYDKAALLFGYSGGKINDPSHHYLYCSDEQTLLNALCNRHDVGTTPSQIMMSLIESYEDLHYRANYRGDAAYWDVQNFEQRIVDNFITMKKFLLLQDETLGPLWMNNYLQESGALKNAPDTSTRLRELAIPIDKDVNLAIKLSLVFFSSVLQQKDSDRPWASEYENFTGVRKQQGILLDKLVAQILLMGDDALPYNPNSPSSFPSFLSYRGDPYFSELVDKVYDSILTIRVASPVGFIDLGRMLFSYTATNPDNRPDESVVSRIRVAKYSDRQMNDLFAMNSEFVASLPPVLIASREEFKRMADNYYPENDVIGIAKIGGDVYMVSKTRSPYAFSIVEHLQNAYKSQDSIIEPQRDLVDLYNLYRAVAVR